MKINLIKGRNSKYNSLVEEIAMKLFPQAKVECKLEFKPSELKDSVVLEVSSLSGKSNREIALKLCEVTGMGISEKVLESL